MARTWRLDSIRQDIRFGVRTLARRPGFTVLALITLAIGIGANAAIFSVINGVLLRPLPYPESDRLVTLWEVGEQGGEMHVAAPNFHDWHAQARSFSALATHPSYRFGGPTTVLGGAEPVRVWAAYVSGDFFQEFVRRFLGDREPIGSVLRNLSNDAFHYGDDPLTIVGVVDDVRHGGLLGSTTPEVYVNAAQRAFRARGATLVLRSRNLSPALVAAVRDRMRALDANVPIAFRTMRDRVDGSLADRRFSVLVLGTFAAIALVLAGVGIYGVVSYSVERRRREMGVRLALGAAPGSVRALVVRDAMRVVLAGLAIGTAAALATSRLIRGMLFGVGPADPATFATVVVLLGGVALLASWIPALRTTRLDPMRALHSE